MMDFETYRNMVEKAHIELETLFPDIQWDIGVSSTHQLYVSATRENGHISVRFQLQFDHLLGKKINKLAVQMASLL